MAKSQNNLRVVLTQFRVGILLLCPQGNIEFASDHCASIPALNPATLLGRPRYQALSLSPALVAQLAAMLALNADSRTRLELNWQEPGDRSVWVKCDVRDDPSDPGRRMLFLNDISEVRELHLRIAQSAYHHMIGASEAMRLL